MKKLLCLLLCLLLPLTALAEGIAPLSGEDFTLSVTPHTTTYIKGRFIHGIPCRTRDESTRIGYLEKHGAITGGCLRSPMEFARFVYMNCPSYQSELVVVNGGLQVPEATITPEELFAAMEGVATPTDL